MTIRTLLAGLLVALTFQFGVARADDAAEKTSKKPAAAAPQPAPVDERARLTHELANRADAIFLDTQLGDVVDELKKRHHINIELDINALTADGKGPETIINCDVKQLALASLLTQVLKPVGLTWTLADEMIVITTPTAEATYLITTVYPVADFADSDGNIDFDELSEMIRQSVAHESWREAGGMSGTIARVTNKKALVITQTYHNHRAIAAILKQLSEK